MCLIQFHIPPGSWFVQGGTSNARTVTYPIELSHSALCRLAVMTGANATYTVSLLLESDLTNMTLHKLSNGSRTDSAVAFYLVVGY